MDVETSCHKRRKHVADAGDEKTETDEAENAQRFAREADDAFDGQIEQASCIPLGAAGMANGAIVGQLDGTEA